MTITLELQSDIGKKLRGKAEAHGMDVPEYVRFLAEQDVSESLIPLDLFGGYPALDPNDEDDFQKIHAGIERGKADFAEGRYSSAGHFHVIMNARHGIPD